MAKTQSKALIQVDLATRNVAGNCTNCTRGWHDYTQVVVIRVSGSVIKLCRACALELVGRVDVCKLLP